MSEVISLLTNQITQTNVSEGNQLILDALADLKASIDKLVDIAPRPVVLLSAASDGLSSNVADTVLIARGFPIPVGFIAVFKDWALTFTTVAGTVKIVKLNSSNIILEELIVTINASDGGSANTTLLPGEKLAVVGQSAGAGIFGLICSGTIQRQVI